MNNNYKTVKTKKRKNVQLRMPEMIELECEVGQRRIQYSSIENRTVKDMEHLVTPDMCIFLSYYEELIVLGNDR